MTTHERRRVLYSGHVQGVGFRFNARRCAEALGATGFVRNLSDGRVELVAEGSPETLDNLLAKIAESMDDYIADTQIESLPAEGEYADFRIA